MSQSEWNIAICGLNCAKCGLFRAEKCGGCRASVEKHWSPSCRMRSCSLGRGTKYCFECTSYPCEDIKSFASDGLAHHKTTVENMNRMKKVGIQAWIDEQPIGRILPRFPESLK